MSDGTVVEQWGEAVDSKWVDIQKRVCLLCLITLINTNSAVVMMVINTLFSLLSSHTDFHKMVQQPFEG